jgi:hypothetical protein
MSAYNTQREVGVNIKVVVRETGYEGLKWMELVQEHDQ